MTDDESGGVELDLGAPPNWAENAVQGIGLFPQFSGVRLKTDFRARDHAQKEFCFPRFLPTNTDAVLEVGTRNSVVRFAIVRSHARCRANELIDKSVVYRTV